MTQTGGDYCGTRNIVAVVAQYEGQKPGPFADSSQNAHRQVTDKIPRRCRHVELLIARCSVSPRRRCTPTVHGVGLPLDRAPTEWASTEGVTVVEADAQGYQHSLCSGLVIFRLTRTRRPLCLASSAALQSAS